MAIPYIKAISIHNKKIDLIVRKKRKLKIF